MQVPLTLSRTIAYTGHQHDRATQCQSLLSRVSPCILRAQECPTPTEHRKTVAYLTLLDSATDSTDLTESLHGVDAVNQPTEQMGAVLPLNLSERERAPQLAAAEVQL